MTINKDILLKSAVFDLQQTYNQYKQEIQKVLQLSGYDSNGDLWVVEGYEDHLKRANELANKMNELQAYIKEIRSQDD